MGKYYFEEKKIENDFQFIFLCGVDYSVKKEDKRNVLSSFLTHKNPYYRPIILEKRFGLEKKIPNVLSYGDIYLKDLYEIETLTTYLSDAIIIIHESISTGAETGLFLGNTEAAEKSCLLIPDIYAVEEDKIGTFMKLAFFLNSKRVSKIDFYPSVKKYMLSSNVKKWHSFFPDNKIGDNLGNKIIRFLDGCYSGKTIKFTNNEKEVKNGKIYFKIGNGLVNIIIRPNVLSVCVASLFSLAEVRDYVFNKKGHTVKEIIKKIKEDLENTFLTSIEEKKGVRLPNYSCKITADMNVNDVSINAVIGLIFYFFQAARFVEIKKGEEYETKSLVFVKEKMVPIGNTYCHFYDKYRDIINTVSEKRIE